MVSAEVSIEFSKFTFRHLRGPTSAEVVLGISAEKFNRDFPVHNLSIK